MSQPNSTQTTGKSSSGKKALWVGAIALIVVALGAGLFSYVGTTPHTVTSVSTSYATNTSTVTNTQIITSLTTNTFTNLVTTTAPPGSNPYAQQYCPPNCQQQPCYYNGCQAQPNCYYQYGSCYYYDSNCYYYGQCDFSQICSSQNNNTVQCSGYLYQDPSGCVELVIAIWSPYAQPSYQYFSLQNLPASHPAFGSWVTVTGQSYRGSNTASNGAGCPGNYIVVSSIS
jgi:hypothetical protein